MEKQHFFPNRLMDDERQLPKEEPKEKETAEEETEDEV